jgi:hypothetical protein
LANSVSYIPQIDYTSKDYVAIKNDLLALIPNYAPNWTSRDPSDFGMALVELFSYMGDMLSFYIDRAANEGFIATASQRDSILQLAGMLGYQPTTSTPAITAITFTNSTSSSVTIPAKTQLATSTVVNGLSTQVIFETDVSVTVPAKTTSGSGAVINGTASVSATQGYTVYTEPSKISTGTPNQVFSLSQSPVINNSISVTVNGVSYSYVSSLIDAGMYDPVFTTLIDANNTTYIVFGDGISGRIPPASGTIDVVYRVGAGKAGNVIASTLTYFLTNAVSGVTAVNYEAAAGGADAESTDSIRMNAPLALRALNRAVSLKDYAYLALQVSGVAKAVADASTSSSINLYVAPFGDNGYASGNSGATSASFNNLATNVVSYFMDKTAPNVSLTVLPPTYVPIDISITVNVLPQYRQDTVITQSLAAIRDMISQSNSFFADRVPSQFVLYALGNIPGIDYAQVTLLVRATPAIYWSRTSNVVTLYYPYTNPIVFTSGQSVVITDISTHVDAPANNTYSITGVSTATVSGTTYNTLTFASTGTNQTTPLAATGTFIRTDQTGTSTVTCNVNEIPIEGVFSVTAVGGIS